MSEALADKPHEIAHRSPRWMWIVMIASLSVNLLVIGIVSGSIWAIKRGGYWNIPTTIERNYRFLKGLPEDRRDEIKTIFFAHKPDLKPHWQSVRQARSEIASLLRQENVSESELNAAMEKLFTRELHAWQAAKPMLQAMLAKLTIDERMHFLRVFVPYLEEAQGQGDVALER